MFKKICKALYKMFIISTDALEYCDPKIYTTQF